MVLKGGLRDCTMKKQNSKTNQSIVKKQSSKNNQTIVETKERKNVNNVSFKLYIDKTDFVYVFNKAYIGSEVDKIYLKILKFSNEYGEPYYRLTLKGIIVGAIYPTSDESSLSFNSIALDSYAIVRILNTKFLYKDRLKSVFWLKELKYVRDGVAKHARLVTLPCEDGLSVGSAFMSNR